MKEFTQEQYEKEWLKARREFELTCINASEIWEAKKKELLTKRIEMLKEKKE